MYNVTFEADNGKKYVFGHAGSTVFDMDLGTGLTVNLGTTQGFAQIGETVESQSVSGRPITVKGAVFGNIPERKRTMRNVLAPFTAGRLIFENSYFIRVYVKDAPSFSPVKNDGRFTMRFYAPFPYFYGMEQYRKEIGAVKPLFSFPVNYSAPHAFGTRGAARYTNIYNDGDVQIPFEFVATATGTSTNATVTNLKTFAFLRLNGTLEAGDTVRVYRDNNNILRAEKTSDGLVSDIIAWVDEDSTLFQLDVGDNLISANDDEGGQGLTVQFVYRTAVGAVYEA